MEIIKRQKNIEQNYKPLNYLKMTMDELKIRCRVEELPFLAKFVRDSYTRDQSEFVTYSPVFNSEFLTRYDFLLALIEGLVSPKSLTGERKMITVRLQLNYGTTRSIINKVEGYANLAKSSLTMSPADFGFNLLRKSLDAKNDEGIIKNLKTLAQNIGSNVEALRKVGLSDSYRNEINDFLISFETDVLNQARKLRERRGLVHENRKQFNELWDLLILLIDTGKIIFKEKKDALKIKDYTYSELMKNVRKAYHKQEEEVQAQIKAETESEIKTNTPNATK